MYTMTKHIKIFALLLAALISLASCATSDIDGNSDAPESSAVYDFDSYAEYFGTLAISDSDEHLYISVVPEKSNDDNASAMSIMFSGDMSFTAPSLYLNSRHTCGTWKINGDFLKLTQQYNNQDIIIVFRIEKDALIYQKEQSQGSLQMDIEDGQRFVFSNAQNPLESMPYEDALNIGKA